MRLDYACGSETAFQSNYTSALVTSARSRLHHSQVSDQQAKRSGHSSVFSFSHPNLPLCQTRHRIAHEECKQTQSSAPIEQNLVFCKELRLAKSTHITAESTPHHTHSCMSCGKLSTFVFISLRLAECIMTRVLLVGCTPALPVFRMSSNHAWFTACSALSLFAGSFAKSYVRIDPDTIRSLNIQKITIHDRSGECFFTLSIIKRIVTSEANNPCVHFF